MDIRRVRLNDERNATVLSNDLVRAVIDDRSGRLVAYSAMNIHGGWVNAHKLHQFPFSRDTALQNQLSLSMRCELLERLNGYQMRIKEVGSLNTQDKEPTAVTESTPVATDEEVQDSLPSFNKFGNESTQEKVTLREKVTEKVKAHTLADSQDHEELLDDLYDRSRPSWVIERYGSDFKSGAVWLLSKKEIIPKSTKWRAERLDVVLPNHPCVYSVLYITNVSLGDLSCDIGYDNALAAPFLESGCQVNTSCEQWSVVKHGRCFGCAGHIIKDEKTFPLDKIPLSNNSTIDLKTVPGPLGTTDAMMGKNNMQEKGPIWASVINPKQQLVYVTFTPGVEDRTPSDIPLSHSTLLFDYGGRSLPPWSLYEGGTSNEFSLHLGACTSDLANEDSVIIKSGRTKRMMYARALTSYDNFRMGGNFNTLEMFNHNIVLKRTRSSIVIPSDPHFTQVRELAKRLVPYFNLDEDEDKKDHKEKVEEVIVKK